MLSNGRQEARMCRRLSTANGFRAKAEVGVVRAKMHQVAPSCSTASNALPSEPLATNSPNLLSKPHQNASAIDNVLPIPTIPVGNP